MSNPRSMYGLRALVLSVLAAYLLLVLGLRAAQVVMGTPETPFVEVLEARIGPPR